jgi:hypothetical protein
MKRCVLWRAADAAVWNWSLRVMGAVGGVQAMAEGVKWQQWNRWIHDQAEQGPAT